MDGPVVLGAKLGQHPEVAMFAIGEAMRRGAPLRVVHASNDAHVARTLFDEVKQLVAVEPDLDVDFAVVGGDASDVLLGEAQHAGVLVVGADDAPWMARASGTEISQVIVSQATAPVIVVPRTTLRGRVTCGVVAAVDVAVDAEGQLEFALETAARQLEPLHVVHVAGIGDQSARRHRRQDLEEVVDRCRKRHPPLAIDTTVETGYAVHTCLIASARASVLVLGQTTEERHRLVSRPAVSRLLRRSSAPVAIVP